MTAVISQALRIIELLEKKEHTAAELADAAGLGLRRTYRLLGALKEAGVQIEEWPDPRRTPAEGRVPTVFRVGGKKPRQSSTRQDRSRGA
jgi:hypothetical protein